MSDESILHKEQSLKILAHLTGWGFSAEVQQRLGAFSVLWSVFESTLETTLWAITDERVAGKYPSTDKTSISTWIKKLGERSLKFNQEAQELVSASAKAAVDLMEYRHALAHGWLIPFPSGATFIRNPSWNGENRSRPTNDAHVNENLLDMAIDCAWTLCQVVTYARSAAVDSEKLSDLIALKNHIHRAVSEANELRHLTDLMNHEKS
nr:hypothetical protein [uncultured Rhodoferax sp.]